MRNVEGVQSDTSILSCKANSKMLDAHLVLVLVLFAKFCLFPMESFVCFIGNFYLYFLVCPYILLHCLLCWKALSVCLLQKLFPLFHWEALSVFSGVSLKFGYNHGVETQIGKMFFALSVQQSQGCFMTRAQNLSLSSLVTGFQLAGCQMSFWCR